LALPAVALATQEAGRALARRFGQVVIAACVIAVSAFLVVQVVDLEQIVSTNYTSELRGRVLGIARIMRDGEPIASTNIFGIFYLSDPSTTAIARLDQEGELPALDVSTDDILTARVYVEAVLGSASPYPEGVAELVDVAGGSATATTEPGCF